MSQPQYLSRALAAKRLDISERRLLELAARGDIAREFVRDPRSGQKTSVFPAAGIESYLARITEKRAISPPSPANSAPTHNDAMLHGIPAHIAAMPATQPMQPAQPLALWLTLAQAAEYSGLPAGYLRQRIRGGSLRALNVGTRSKGGPWRVSRKELHAIEGTLQIEGVRE